MPPDDGRARPNDNDLLQRQPQINTIRARANVNDPELQGDRCKHCRSTALRTDWKNGDIVCTDCGVVAEERLCDDRPEWKEFGEAEDLVKGLPASARSGLVPVDESKYIGGLQPTSLSKHPFGGDLTHNNGYGEARIRKRLIATNRKLDKIMHRMHASAVATTSGNRVSFPLSRSAPQTHQSPIALGRRVRRRLVNGFDNQNADGSGTINPAHQGGLESDVNDDDSTVLDEGSFASPENDKFRLQTQLEVEEDVHRMQAALFSEKWSLSRAIFLHGSDEERSARASVEGQHPEELTVKMNSVLKKASEDLYRAYSMIQQCAKVLQLPQRVVDEATRRLERYTIQRDGPTVKGIASRLPKSSSKESQAQRMLAATRLRIFNKVRQIASLVAALLFLVTRHLGWARTAAEICKSLKAFKSGTSDPSSVVLTKEAVSIKMKHISRALTELKATFPDMAHHIMAEKLEMKANTKSEGEPGNSTCVDDRLASAVSDFADGTLRRLQLPSLAEDCIRTILVHCRRQQLIGNHFAETRLATMCASVAFFVCQAGSLMQRLARRGGTSPVKKDEKSKGGLPQRRRPASSAKRSARNQIVGAIRFTAAKDAQLSWERPHTSPNATAVQISAGSNSSACSPTDEDESSDDDSAAFDVFSHPAILHDSSETTLYEMSRMWDAWVEQLPWTRSTAVLEQMCGVSSSTILEFYKISLYPQRQMLLNLLKDASQSPGGALRDSPMAPLLLNHILVVSPLMNVKE